MHRAAFLVLSLTASAATFLTPAAHAADPLCAAVWAVGTAVPPAVAGTKVSVCVPYAYDSRYCVTGDEGVSPELVLYDSWCVPE